MTTIPSSRFSVPSDVSHSVLIADSDKDEHLVTSVVASKWFPDWGLDFADDGAQLLLKLAFIESIDGLPGLIVLNREMPRYDGLRTLCELQAHPVLWQIPVIVLIDAPDAEVEIDCYRSGARWVQAKPHDLDGMIKLFDRVELFAAQPFSYHPCGCMNISVFNQEYAEEIERSLEITARARRLTNQELSFPAAA